MLPLPENDYTRPQVLASWIELIALSENDGAAYRGTIVENMRDSQLYPESTLDNEKAGDSSDPNSAPGKLAEAWRVLRARQQLLNGAWPFELTEHSLVRRDGRKLLENVVAYTAMLIMEAASLKWYSRAAIQPGDPIRQWFEEITVIALRRITNGNTIRFGAPFPVDWPKSFVERVKHLAGHFNVSSRDDEVAKHSSPEQQDDSLDVVARMKFTDELGGVPYILVQCATGANWSVSKPAQPTITLWDKYIAWDGPRIKALALPFTLRNKGELENASVRHLNALVFDRIRLAGTLPDNFISAELRANLQNWVLLKFSAIQGPIPPVNNMTPSQPA